MKLWGFPCYVVKYGTDFVINEDVNNLKQNKMNKNFENLTKEELLTLRKDIVLNSIYIHDYENSFGFEPSVVSVFFDGFVEYICELAAENGVTDFERILKEYDTDDNLLSWFNCYDDLSWITFANGFRIGDKVKWEDPGLDDFDFNERESQKERVYEIIEVLNDEMFLISDDYGNSEVFVDELIKVA